MALSDIRQFNFYFKYLWAPADFDNMQTWIQAQIDGIAEGAFGAACLSGAVVSPGGGMVQNFTSGILVSPSGRIVVLASGSGTIATPAGNPARSVIVARPKLTDMTNIPEPANPLVTVPLHEKLDYDIVVLNGTPSGTPVYPALGANDIVLMGFLVPSGATSLTLSNYEYSKRDRARRRAKSVRTVSTTSDTLTSTDEHIDLDGSANNVTALLPNASDMVGQDIDFVRTDSTANTVAVSGADLISGQNQWTLDDQWATLKLRAVVGAWRIL